MVSDTTTMQGALLAGLHSRQRPKENGEVHKKKKRMRRKKWAQMEQEAARRTCNSNGSNPSLPPLPMVSGDGGSGMETLFGHPYGALPFGNSWLEENKNDTRPNGLGGMRLLNDEQVLSVLSFCDGPALAQVVQTSRYLYVAGHHDELWRDLILRHCDTHNQPLTFVPNGKWKDSYCQQVHASASIAPHVPLPIKGVYSDTFYRSYLCRSFQLQPEWLKVETVTRIPHDSVTADEFVEQFERPNVPVVLAGATKSWPAIQQWSPDYLQTICGADTCFRATSGAAPLPASMTLNNYFTYCQSTVEEAPLYLFDRTFAQRCPQLLQDYFPALEKSCPMFGPKAKHGHDLFGLLGSGKRPDHRWIIMGPPRSGSAFHIDPNATHAWNAPIRGRKRWIFYPPGVNPPGVHPSPSGDDVAMPISIGEWFLTYWNDHVRARRHPDPKQRPLECTVSPGDILFVPHGWWHMVLNIDDDTTSTHKEPSVALTQNYVSCTNLPNVLRFLQRRQDQISGCRDRAGESIPPEKLHDEFRSVLQNKRPDLLEAAIPISEHGWTCHAWNDDYYNDCTTTTDTETKDTTKHGNGDNLEALSSKRIKTDTGSVVQRAKDDSTSAGFSFSFL